MEFLSPPELASQAAALGQVLLMDLVLAGDNAVAVGLAAAALPQDQRKKAILIGLAAAVVMRIGFALITVQLLALVGLLLAGGLLLLWVCWKMWRGLREQATHDQAEAEAGLQLALGIEHGSGASPGELGV
jgi:predicted tellurium resistance membrane protein TerC